MKHFFNKKSNFLPLVLSFLFLSFLITFYGCTLITGKDDNDDDKKKLLAAAILLSTSSSTSATTTIPESLSGSDSAVSSSTRTVISDTGAATILKSTYKPVRSTIRIARDIIDLSKAIIKELETGNASKITTFPSSYSYTDSKDTVSTSKVFRISKTSTFGGEGKKLEMWWKQNTSSAVTDVQAGNVKQLEFEYYKSSGDVSTDGVMFFRFKDPSSSGLVIVRAEYKRDTATGTKYMVVHLQNLTDVIQATGQKNNAAFYITESSSGLVNIDGVIEMTGIKMPFVDNNTQDTTNWGTTTKRAYIFKGIGSDSTNHAVLKVILPKTGEESGASNPFADAQNWSMGELYTDGLLQSMSNDGVLTSLNSACGTGLATTSTQAETTAGLTTWQSCSAISSNTAAQSAISNAKAITGIKNPVFFLKTGSSNDLIGQENTDGLSTISGANTTTYTTYMNDTTFSDNTIRNDTANGGNFTSSGINVLNILDGTSIGPITGHPTSIVSWTGNADTVPTDVTALSSVK
ncbi:MAG: hypothetical protein H7A23_25645 [Leptospiraceae bacterium]|nr:hypothetical protein [Leptospiraceae bacterium]MCP5497952.1 hypothetical protein [Leptospiraceae bacterium]